MLNKKDLEMEIKNLAAASLDLALMAEHLEEKLRTLSAEPVTEPTEDYRAFDERVRTIITARPMLFRDIIAATGADRNQLGNTLMRLRRDHGVVNLGSKRLAIWFIPTPNSVAKLAA